MMLELLASAEGSTLAWTEFASKVAILRYSAARKPSGRC